MIKVLKRGTRQESVRATIELYAEQHNGATPTNMFLKKAAKPNPKVKMRNYIGSMMARYYPKQEGKNE